MTINVVTTYISRCAFSPNIFLTYMAKKFTEPLKNSAFSFWLLFVFAKIFIMMFNRVLNTLLVVVISSCIKVPFFYPVI